MKLIKDALGYHIKELDGYKLSLKNCQAIEQDSPLQEYVLEVNGEGWDDHLYRGSRKQTEWDVEVEMKKVIDETKIIGAVKGVKGSGHNITTYKSVPKLDADNCLILKKT
ncbi:hypothetical protein UFOVP972_326 [uncultured Caudovirales phage]|uniref:Uncharacterized protein n=1 Tax=uncultured Caudovirales phage TaxID=2100421 RepID=A0A6J5PUZ6_9CAUD|nr:hypothetical protein UFOVP972_326 [uncultured Caudovirales phage]